MCGRYSFYDFEDVSKTFDVETDKVEFKDTYNAAPGQMLPVIIQGKDARELKVMKWGLIPSWAKDDKIGYKMINARVETLFEKPSWRKLTTSQRCLVPVRGYYEWDKIIGNDGIKKQPYYVKPKHRDLFAFAGLYDQWKDDEGQIIWSYSIITTSAGKDMARIHNREPIILKPEDEDLWLDSRVQDRSIIDDLLRKYPDEELEMFEVSSDVNVVRNNDDHLIRPINSQ